DLAGTAGDDEPPHPAPEDLERLDWKGVFGDYGDLLRFHTDAVEIRSVEDSFVRAVPGNSWFRLECDLLAGEEMTAFQRLAVMADLANGDSPALAPPHLPFLDPDIAPHVHPLPA